MVVCRTGSSVANVLLTSHVNCLTNFSPPSSSYKPVTDTELTVWNTGRIGSKPVRIVRYDSESRAHAPRVHASPQLIPHPPHHGCTPRSITSQLIYSLAVLQFATLARNGAARRGRLLAEPPAVLWRSSLLVNNRFTCTLNNANDSPRQTVFFWAKVLNAARSYRVYVTRCACWWIVCSLV